MTNTIIKEMAGSAVDTHLTENRKDHPFHRDYDIRFPSAVACAAATRLSEQKPTGDIEKIKKTMINAMVHYPIIKEDIIEHIGKLTGPAFDDDRKEAVLSMIREAPVRPTDQYCKSLTHHVLKRT